MSVNSEKVRPLIPQVESHRFASFAEAGARFSRGHLTSRSAPGRLSSRSAPLRPAAPPCSLYSSNTCHNDVTQSSNGGVHQSGVSLISVFGLFCLRSACVAAPLLSHRPLQSARPEEMGGNDIATKHVQNTCWLAVRTHLDCLKPPCLFVPHQGRCCSLGEHNPTHPTSLRPSGTCF